MGWKFWKPSSGEPTAKQKLPGPKELPFHVGKYLVVDLNLDPDWVWSLKSVSRRRAENKFSFDVRIFDMAKAIGDGVNVKNYDSLEAHRAQILFEGWYNTETREVHLTTDADKAA